MKLCGFANFVEQHLVPYEYVGINLVVIEATKWLLQRGILLYDGNKQLTLGELLYSEHRKNRLKIINLKASRD